MIACSGAPKASSSITDMSFRWCPGAREAKRLARVRVGTRRGPPGKPGNPVLSRCVSPAGTDGEAQVRKRRRTKDLPPPAMIATRTASIAPGRRESAETVRLLEVDPDLGSLLNDARRAEAEDALVVRVHRLGVGPWDVGRLGLAGAGHVGLLILDGVIARDVIVADHVSAELLGPGDLARPWDPPSDSALLPVGVDWWVLSHTRVAVLDRTFMLRCSRWPEVTAALFERLSERALRLATHQAISQLTRVDRRLLALFWHLAERWGRMSRDGVVVPLALTHRILGQLVGARRPTVSTALGELAERDELIRRPDGSWLLRGDPPEALDRK